MEQYGSTRRFTPWRHEEEAAYFVRLNEWRARERIPEEVFFRSPLPEFGVDDVAGEFFGEYLRNRKPQYLDFLSRLNVRHLGRLLVERNRIEAAPRIVEIYGDLLRAERGIAVAEATTAEPLSPGAEAMVRDKLQSLVGKQVELRVSVDPGIIGGLVARVGDRVIDGSVVGQLRKLRARLASAT